MWLVLITGILTGQCSGAFVGIDLGSGTDADDCTASMVEGKDQSAT